MIPTIFARIPTDPRKLFLSGSVGRSARNLRADVHTVQSILNATRPFVAPQQAALTVDGLVGPKTVGAIERFQFWNRSAVDGRMDPRGPAILSAVALLEDKGAMPAPMPGLERASSDEVAAFAGIGTVVQGSSTATSKYSNGFGLPFTASQFIIKRATTAEVTIDRGGGFSAVLEIEDEATRTIHRMGITAGLVAASPKGGLPIGVDVALPKMKSAWGRLHRGLLPSAIGRHSLYGVVGVTLIGGNLFTSDGAGFVLYRFQWLPTPPGMCSAWAATIGQQIGIPGVSVASGIGIAVPV
jgi:peptidoglycan hydrolase-like protein with peptidoglycan-binding domain